MVEANKQPGNSKSREQQYDDFVVLLSRHDLAIRRFIRSIMPSADGVDDVMQETALVCWKKFDEFRPDDSLTASEEFIRWACVIARYKAMSWQRDHARGRLIFRDRVLEMLAEASVERLDRLTAEHAAIEKCLGKLDADQRRLVLSVHAPGDSVAAIAKETGQVARRLYQRVNTLRAQLMKCVQRQVAAELSNG